MGSDMDVKANVEGIIQMGDQVQINGRSGQTRAAESFESTMRYLL